MSWFTTILVVVLAASSNGLSHEQESRRTRNIYRSANKWPEGVVYFKLDEQYNKTSRNIIKHSFDAFEEAVAKNGRKCVQFVDQGEDTKDYVYFTPKTDSCISEIGKLGGEQVTKLGDRCLRKMGKIHHELMHILGFLHEHSRPDRDRYVKILWKNVKTGQENNFQKFGDNIASRMGFAYDYSSLMHYSSLAYSRNGEPTLEALSEHGSDKMGQREELSELDILKIRSYYGCS